MYRLNGWWFLSYGGAYPSVFTVELLLLLFIVVHGKVVHTNCHKQYAYLSTVHTLK